MRIKPIGQGGYVVLTEALGAKINIPTHYDMFAENLENPLLFSENIGGGRVFEFNKEYEISF